MALFKPKRTVGTSIAELVNEHMSAIKQQFPDAKLTLVIRSERFEKPIIFTNDQPEATIAAIREMVSQKDDGRNNLHIN